MPESVSMSQVLGDAAPPPVVRANGRDWKVGPPTQAAKLELELLITGEAEDRVFARRGKARPEVFAALWEDHKRDLRTGRYDTLTGDLWREAAFDAGRAPLLFLTSLLRCHHPDATPADAAALVAAEPERVEAAFLRVLPDFFAGLLDDPRLPAGERAGIARELTAAVATLLASRAPTPESSTPA